MAVLSKEEFVTKVTTESNADPSSDTWMISAATVVALVSMDHDKFSKDDIVEAIQNLAFRMTGELVQAATANMIVQSMGMN